MSSTDMPMNLDNVLGGLLFPAAKVEIITYADEQGASMEAMELLRMLPVRKYNNLQEIGAELNPHKEALM